VASRCHPTIPSSHHSGIEVAERVWLPIHALEILKTMERHACCERMQRCVEDINHAFSDVQKFMRTGTRLAQSGNGRS
jgi:hypothetical protein